MLKKYLFYLDPIIHKKKVVVKAKELSKKSKTKVTESAYIRSLIEKDK